MAWRGEPLAIRLRVRPGRGGTQTGERGLASAQQPAGSHRRVVRRPDRVCRRQGEWGRFSGDPAAPWPSERRRSGGCRRGRGGQVSCRSRAGYGLSRPADRARSRSRATRPDLPCRTWTETRSKPAPASPSAPSRIKSQPSANTPRGLPVTPAEIDTESRHTAGSRCRSPISPERSLQVPAGGSRNPHAEGPMGPVPVKIESNRIDRRASRAPTPWTHRRGAGARTRRHPRLAHVSVARASGDRTRIRTAINRPAAQGFGRRTPVGSAQTSRGSRSRSISASRGASASLAERIGRLTGHRMPSAGSSQRTVSSWAGRYGVVHL